MHFRISLHEYGIARTLPPFVDFNRTCQHCQFNYYSISIGVTYADTCRLFFHKIPKTKHKFSVLFSSRYDNVYIWETDEKKGAHIIEGGHLNSQSSIADCR